MAVAHRVRRRWDLRSAQTTLIVCDDIENEAEALHVADRVSQAVKEPFPIRGRDTYVTLSIGVVVWPVLLGFSEVKKASGQMLLCSAVVGYQVMARLGAALVTKELARKFRPTGLIGAVGGAAAGACLLNHCESV